MVKKKLSSIWGWSCLFVLRSEHISMVLYNLCDIGQPLLSEMFNILKVAAKSCYHNKLNNYTQAPLHMTMTCSCTLLCLFLLYIYLIYKSLFMSMIRKICWALSQTALKFAIAQTRICLLWPKNMAIFKC
jgi:hypothetical protein